MLPSISQTTDRLIERVTRRYFPKPSDTLLHFCREPSVEWYVRDANPVLGNRQEAELHLGDLDLKSAARDVESVMRMLRGDPAVDESKSKSLRRKQIVYCRH